MSLNLDNMKNYFRNNYSYLPYLIYSLITFFIWYKTKFNIFELIPDFNFYFSYAYNFWGDFNSDLSTNILDAYDGLLHTGVWQPSPIYPLLILSPINIFGSKVLFAIEGYLFGICYIYFLKKIIYQVDLGMNERLKLFSLIACTLSPVMLMNTIALTNVGLWGLLLIIAIYYSNNFIIRTLCLIIASMVRPNFAVLLLILFICYLKNIIPRSSRIKLSLFLVTIFYIIFYIAFHQNYPGNFINYFFYPAGQGLSTFADYGKEYLFRTLDYVEPYTESFKPLLNDDLNLFSIIKVINSLEGINYVFQLFIARVNSLLGYNLEGLYELRLNYSQWISKILRTFYYFFLIMPGFLLSIKLSIETLINKSRFESKEIKFFILISFLYVIFSSILIAVPRYLFPFDSILICLGVNFWFIGKNNIVKT